MTLHQDITITVRNGSRVKILDSVPEGFVVCQYNGFYFIAPESKVRPPSPPPPPPPPPKPTKTVLYDFDANGYANGVPVVKNEQVTVLEAGEQWTTIKKFDGKEGQVPTSYLG